ncbi:MAG: transcriptional repressor [Deltaproteobacteria bacterium]|nr:transcriptional repressor [Deltaproteobacteria bacterium]MBZ0219491.1 transcriptional repressor [Deltaproteobacteria bacterium]
MERIVRKYRGMGFKLTPQRLAILKFLEGNTSHPTAEDIYTEIKKRYPTVSFATVYNTIQALKERGEIMEVTIDPERKHFDPNPAPHHHIMCTGCGRIGDVFVDYSVSLKLPDEVTREFTTTGNHIDFYGLCNRCRLKQTN